VLVPLLGRLALAPAVGQPEGDEHVDPVTLGEVLGDLSPRPALGTQEISETGLLLLDAAGLIGHYKVLWVMAGQMVTSMTLPRPRPIQGCADLPREQGKACAHDHTGSGWRHAGIDGHSYRRQQASAAPSVTGRPRLVSA
jgi:hypothetical protein